MVIGFVEGAFQKNVRVEKQNILPEKTTLSDTQGKQTCLQVRMELLGGKRLDPQSFQVRLKFPLRRFNSYKSLL